MSRATCLLARRRHELFCVSQIFLLRRDLRRVLRMSDAIKLQKIAGNSYLNLEPDLPLLNDDSSRAFLALGKQTGINLCCLQLLLISKAAR